MTVATSNPDFRAASNHISDSRFILGSLITTRGAGGSVARYPWISAMQAVFSTALNASGSCKRNVVSNRELPLRCRILSLRMIALRGSQ
ncbi:Uncharacterised protein [Mycobacteroides abscessus subsp. abscessus]|nr:Uncharacterised protein [Mycobacteroides abscessus subsp. abscessus]